MAKTIAKPSMDVVLHNKETVTINNQYIGDIISDTQEGETIMIPFHSVIAISPKTETEEVEDTFCTDIPDYEVADCMESEDEEKESE